jgi:hypothetical protein
MRCSARLKKGKVNGRIVPGLREESLAKPGIELVTS